MGHEAVGSRESGVAVRVARAWPSRARAVTGGLKGKLGVKTPW